MQMTFFLEFFRIRTNSACENDADRVDGLLAIPYM